MTNDTSLNMLGKAFGGLPASNSRSRLPMRTGGLAEGLFIVVQVSQGIAL